MKVRFELIFIWLPSAEFAVRRVASRTAMGGHNVPVETIRRRYQAGLRNFFEVYSPIVSTWRLYDGCGHVPRPVAARVEKQVQS